MSQTTLISFEQVTVFRKAVAAYNLVRLQSIFSSFCKVVKLGMQIVIDTNEFLRF